MRLFLTALAACLFLNVSAQAQEKGCTLIVDFQTSKTLHEQGDCQTRYGAQSTFKIPLAIMGFDSGILKDAHNPSWEYEEGFTLNRPTDNAAVDPTYWEKESVVWFSQKLTKAMGFDTFKRYIEQFQYGNQDVSGDPNKNNGLTNAWLSSSLKISAAEQVQFITKLLSENLGVTNASYSKTRAILPQFNAGEWSVHGKTGTGFARKNDGTIDRNRQQGWFVGWAEKGGQTLVFAKFIADDKKQETYAGPRARDEFLKELPQLIKAAP